MAGHDRNSMLEWWPKIESLPIPQPRTTLLEEPVPGLLMRWLWQCEGEGPLNGADATAWDEYMADVRRAADEIGYPIFLRTDHVSNKHAYERACFLPAQEDMFEHLYEILVVHGIAFGLDNASALAVREWLDLDSSFKAFGGMPVAPERRYFVRDGAVQCHHPYWPEEAIQEWTGHALAQNWRELLAEMNRESAAEVEQLTDLAECVGHALPGFWSVDFARAKSGVWFLIDMATGDASWHPEHEASAEGRDDADEAGA